MSITTDLAKRAPSLLKFVPEVTDREGKGYLMADDGGVEAEVGEFLYGLVRILKPKAVLNTGTYSGISDMYIAEALRENGYGHCTSVEYEEIHLRRATELWRILGLDQFVNCTLSSSLDFDPTRTHTMPPEGYDLIFLDTELNLRFHELVKFFPYLKEGGYVFIHDLPISLCQGNFNPDHPDIQHWPVGEIPEQVKSWVKEDRLRPMHFPSPRGLLGFYKPQAREYKFV